MRTLTHAVVILMVLFLTACGGQQKQEGQVAADKTVAAAAAEPAPGEVMPMSQADWAGLTTGKVTFVELWGVWCGPCIQSMPAVQAHWEHYKDNPDFRMMVVNTAWHGDNLERVQGWLSKNSRYTFPVYVEDRGQEAHLAMVNRVNSIPRSLVYNKKGELVFNDHPSKLTHEFLDQLLAE